MKKKDTCLIGVFIAVIFFLVLGFIFLPKEQISKEERRELAKVPTLGIESVMDGSYMEGWEAYFLDHIPFRNSFRLLHTGFLKDVYGKKDVNGYVQVEDCIYRLDEAMQEKKIMHAATIFQRITDTYFVENPTYYALIPDKNYFLPEELGYPRFAYEEEVTLLAEELSNSQYIDIMHLLSIEDYYRTDLHWRQECIEPVAKFLLEQMGAESVLPASECVTATEAFAGSYLLSSSYGVAPDTLCYLDNEILQEAVVYDYEKQANVPVYTMEKLGAGDDYDVFLGGARAILRLENEQCKTGRSLILFRDSFGSSLAPLLLPSYESITMIDLRYVPADYALSMVTWDAQTEVLFLYQTTMLNHSDSFRS